MNITYGASMLSFIPPNWKEENVLYAIEHIAANKFDLIELLLPHHDKVDTHKLKRHLQKYSLQVSCALNLDAETHIPTHPHEALDLIKKSLETAATLGATFIGGVLHSGIGVFSGNPVTQEELKIISEVLHKAAIYANNLGITIGIEPINRYESYVCNTANNVLALINSIGESNLVVHLDTFHMNIEEANFHDPIIASGNKLKHLHITESNRGKPGDGTINWSELFNALKTIDFEGNLVLENFSSHVKGMQSAVSLWQPSKLTAKELASQSLMYLKTHVQTL
ncbi:tagatose 3-epimerase [Neptunitalea chrysea]|uniref:Tagatose 3-epimerase n=1 Tax=Neptunitalea chrysea TaxID=1647581 RepID=A0A9W6B6B4_9FLAO|nr:sugar phosphate isomerase/epimerase family protein [Neptunitalea chrysea]GLB52107.1 tagatose 3-epimerase [Neptunitalea chrysea]